jgi:hypothetical protein
MPPFSQLSFARRVKVSQCVTEHDNGESVTHTIDIVAAKFHVNRDEARKWVRAVRREGVRTKRKQFNRHTLGYVSRDDGVSTPFSALPATIARRLASAAIQAAKARLRRTVRSRGQGDRYQPYSFTYLLPHMSIYTALKKHGVFSRWGHELARRMDPEAAKLFRKKPVTDRIESLFLNVFLPRADGKPTVYEQHDVAEHRDASTFGSAVLSLTADEHPSFHVFSDQRIKTRSLAFSAGDSIVFDSGVVHSVSCTSVTPRVSIVAFM